MLERFCAFVLALALFLAMPAAAAGLIPVSADRSVFVSAVSECIGCGEMGEDIFFADSDSDDTQAFGAWDVQVVAVGSGSGQDSIVSNGQLSGFGFVSLGFSALSEGSSIYHAVFQVATSGSWSLSGSLAGTAESEVRLSDTTSDLVFVNNDLGPLDFDEVLALVAGQDYELWASVSNDFGESGEWSFTLIPEPGSGLLALLGLVGLCVSRRRR